MTDGIRVQLKITIPPEPAPGAVNVSYKVTYRSVRVTDEGGMSPEQTVAAGG